MTLWFIITWCFVTMFAIMAAWTLGRTALYMVCSNHKQVTYTAEKEAQ